MARTAPTGSAVSSLARDHAAGQFTVYRDLICGDMKSIVACTRRAHQGHSGKVVSASGWAHAMALVRLIRSVPKLAFNPTGFQRKHRDTMKRCPARSYPLSLCHTCGAVHTSPMRWPK